MGTSIIEVQNLKKNYDAVEALRGVSFGVEEGEVFGLLGPNGAGKTTTIEILEGLRRADGGIVSVCGMEPISSGNAYKQLIGGVLQATSLPDKMRVGEAVELFASFYAKHRRTDDLLKRFGLEEKKGAFYSQISGGQKQRLFIALALINDPEVVFLDELTTGLDPQARRAIWDLVRGIRDRGKTVFMTTHLMEEAERLCDRVAIIEHGKIIDMGRPEELVRRHCPARTVVLATDHALAEERLRAIRQAETVTRQDSRFTIQGRGDDFVTEVIHCLSENRIRVTDFRTVLPNLEDVFLKLTGHSIRD